MKKILLLFIAVACAVPQVVLAQPKLIEKVEQKAGQVIIPYEKYVLPNGLTVLIHEDHSDPVVQVDVTYHVGSAREEIGKSGFAHFFEHMMFQGSDNVADEQHFKLVTESGGTLNGSTNRDRTNYYETVPANQLEKMLWLEADRMGFLLDAVTQKKFEIQRETVKNERGQNYDNRPYGLVSEVTAKNLYPYGHPYSWLTIGYIEDLNRVNVNDLKNFFLRWYGPNNAVVTVGGDVKPAQVLTLVEKYFGGIPKGPEVKNMKLPAPVLERDRFVTLVDNYAKLPQVVVTVPTVPLYHKDMAALSCLAQVIGQGKASVFYQHLEKKQKAISAIAFSSLTELSGEFSLRATPSPGVTLAELKGLIDSALDSFEVRGVTDEDVAKFKGAFESQTINGLQSVSGKVFQLAQFQTLAGNANMISKLIEMHNAVTKEDVMRVYNQYIKDKPAVILSVATKGQETNIVAAENYKVDASKYKAPEYGYEGLKYTKAKDSFERNKIPGNGANPVVTVPAFWTKELGNGIKVIGSESKELPLVTMSLEIPGGHLLQAADTSKAGLSRIFALMMNEDTKNYSGEQMQIELQKLGSSIRFDSGLDGLTITVQSLKKNIDKTLALLEEKLLNPKFTNDAFTRIQKQTLESFKLRKSQPASVADDVLGELSYGQGHILGINSVGTEFSVRNLSLADVESYYANNIGTIGGKLVVVGDIKESDVLNKVKFLDKLPKKEIKLPQLSAAPAIDKTRVYLVDIPKAAQTQFRIGYVTGMKYDATGEYFKSGLMNYALGGAFNSRLNLNLREDKGWTYGASSRLSGDKYTGELFFGSGIKVDATDSAVVEVMKEFQNYAKAGISDEELEFMRSAVGQRDALRYETPFQKAAFIQRILDYNLPADYVDQQNKIIASINRDEINKLASKWINADKMYILLVGDKAKIYPGLQKLGYEIVELDINGNPKMQASLKTLK
jgi:zinc protease